MPPKFFVILGVSYRVQGDLDFINAFHDPGYEEIAREIITRDNMDFVGEECAVNTTAAGRIAQELLGVPYQYIAGWSRKLKNANKSGLTDSSRELSQRGC